MKQYQSLFFLGIIVFLGTACQTFDHPISPDPLIIKNDLTGVYEVIDNDQEPWEVKDTLRVYMPYPGIYTLEYEKVTKTDSTENSETNMIGVGHLSKFEKEIYFNQTLEGEWIYYQLDPKKKPLMVYFVKLKGFEKHMEHDQVLAEIKNGNFELADEMILIKRRDLK